MNKGKLTRKISHEIKEFLTVFLFLAPFFLSFAVYGMYVARNLGGNARNSVETRNSRVTHSTTPSSVLQVVA